MASSQVLKEVLILAFVSTLSGTQESGYMDVYVSTTGNDSPRCGKPSQPCKSITQAVRRVASGGHIFLDGTGTERQPYDCSSSMGYHISPTINVQKNLTMRSIESTAHISCFRGFQFRAVNRELSIVLTGIMFQQTPLIFQDCKFVQVFNCSFRYAITAIKAFVGKALNMKVDIQESSFVKNNASCLEVCISSKENRSLLINVSNTIFKGNGRFGSRLTKGAITITSDTRKPSVFAYVQISCFNVEYMNSHGYFLNLDLPDGITKEHYFDVTLLNNTISHLTRSSARSTKNVANSLYIARARRTQAAFTSLRCSHNQFLRCLLIQSDEAELKVQNSSFVGQSIPYGRGAAIFLETKVKGAISLVNSRFRRNKAKEGGALHIHSKQGTIELAITLANFTQCTSSKYGCAILVGKPEKTIKFINRTGTYKLIANFRQVRVQNCSGNSRSKCSIVHLALFTGRVTISDSTWTNNLNSIDAALMVRNVGGKTDIAILRCFYLHNVLQSALMFPAFGKMAGTVLVKDTAMSNEQIKTHSLFASPKFNIRLVNVSVNSSSATGLAIFHLLRIHIAFPAVNIYIYNCTFLDCAHDIVVNLLDPKEIHFTVRKTIFMTRKPKRKDFAISFSVQPLIHLNKSQAVIELDNDTFDSRPCNVFQLLFPGNKTLKIKRSMFRNGVCLHRYVPQYNNYEVGTGAISVLSNHNRLKKPGCVEKHERKDTHPLWNYDTEVLIEDTTFEGNAGLLAGAVYISNGNVTFNRCIFRNNFATKRSGHIYSAYGTGQINFNNCSFSSSIENLTTNGKTFGKSTFLYSESGGPLIFKNTSMVSTVGQRSASAMVDISYGGYFDIDNKSSIECSTGSQLLFENYTHFVHVYNEIKGSSCHLNVTVLKYSCCLCPPGYYSLEKGVSHGLLVDTPAECFPCPFGANCIEKNIAARPNFWGYPSSNHPPLLSFYPCPEHYCQSPKSVSKGYNSCYGNRTGFLCGMCSPEYSENLFSTECSKRTQCKSYLLLMTTILFTTGLAFYLLFKPSVLYFLRRKIPWFRKREENNLREAVQVDAHSADSGYLKITFYFYQAAELLLIGSAADLLRHKIPLVLPIVDAFNLQLRTLRKVIDCPIAGLTAVTKELLLSATVFLTMAELAVIYCMHVAFNKIIRKERPSLIHYVAAIVELLLLGYERLAETSFTLMHCVFIGSKMRLFTDAEVVCWQWWQYIILTYIVIFVVPFIVILYYGSQKLHNASISTWEFIAACIFPLPFLIYWFIKKVLRITSNSTGSRIIQSNEVLEILHGPFRQPKDNDNGTLYWESVLIGRRFVLLVCHTFITNSMFRMICMTALCVVILLHHVFKNPYRDPTANKAETCSLLALVMMAIINITKAIFISVGTNVAGPPKSYLEALDWFQVCALAFVPTLLSIFLLFAILSQFVRLMVSLGSLIYRCVQWRCSTLPVAREFETPIINSSEEE